MEIEHVENNILQAIEVMSGDTFVLKNKVYIMTDSDVLNPETGYHELLRAVNLSTGELVEIQPNEEVMDIRVVGVVR